MAEVELRQYLEALLAEQQKATEMAERERAKAAMALAVALERSIQEGDERLREHISNQIQQLSAALVSADLLERERVAAVDTRVSELGHRYDERFQAQEQAVLKQEAAQRGVNATQNEFRGSLEDSQRAAERAMGNYLPRREADVVMGELRSTVDKLALRAETFVTDDEQDRIIDRALARVAALEAQMANTRGKDFATDKQDARMIDRLSLWIACGSMLLTLAFVIVTLLSAKP